MFEYCSPEDVNVSSAGIVRFLDEMKQKRLHMHAMMILRHGKVLFESSFEPWSKDNRHMLFSLSKSFTSTAVGFAVQDGLLKTTDRLVDFFPELLTNAPCENMRKVTVKNLLTMNTGHKVEPRHLTDEWEKEFVRSYVDFEPGTHFMYNTYGTFMLSAIVQKATGRKLTEYLKEKLFVPLGMSPDIWTEESPSGVATGGYGLNVRVSDIAKLGQFYLQKGRWNGVQLLNEQWISDAQTPWSDNSPSGGNGDWGQGYGYQFWMCRPEGVFRGDGAFGQYCIVCPKQDMVIAINSGVRDMGAVMQSVWDNILPAVDAPAGDGEQLIVTKTNAFWEDEGLEASDPVLKAEWSGEYRLAKNEYLMLDGVRADGQRLFFSLGGLKTEIPLCRDVWQHADLSGGEEENAQNLFSKIAVRAARSEGKLLLHVCHTRTPFETLLTLTFLPHGLSITGRRNVGPEGESAEVIGYKL